MSRMIRRIAQAPSVRSRSRDRVPRSVWHLWKDLRRQQPAFWFLCFYVIVEYWRIHQAYPALDILPWGQVALGGCLLAFLVQKRVPQRMLALDWIVLAFFAWVAVTSVTAWNPGHSWSNWTTWVGWVLLYFFVSRIPDTPRSVFLYVTFFLFVNLKMSQHGARVFLSRGLSFADWGATGSPGWFQNSGEFAMQMAGIMALSWCFLRALRPFVRRWQFYVLVVLFPGTAFISVLASSSRGGQLAALVAVAVILLLSKVKVRALVAGATAVIIGWSIIPAEQKARFSTMGDDETSQSRLTYWADAWDVTNDHPVFGIGIANWVDYYQRDFGAQMVEVVHNTYLEGSVELGYPGALLFLFGIVACFCMNRDTRRRSRGLGEWARPMHGIALGLDVAMVAFVVAACFMSVLFYPIFWMAFGMTAATARQVRGRPAGSSPMPTRRPVGVSSPPMVRKAPGPESTLALAHTGKTR